MSETCLCSQCSNKKFNPKECMFCHKGIKGEGRLQSPNGARICVSCRDDVVKILKENTQANG